jgi:Tfp pilus assembly protein PilF
MTSQVAVNLRQMSAEEFVRRLHAAMEEEDSRFVFFLGAGCSISSGIPDAGTLVRSRWLPRLMQVQTGREDNLLEWARGTFPAFTPETASQFYGQIIDTLFLNAHSRQQEIERLTAGKDPSFGYAVLAQLMAHERFGQRANVVLTTNFDDMVADALYVYTNKKPLVISHDSLVGFIRVTGTKPLVLKLHGDARLSPRNTTLETRELDEPVRHALSNLLAETGLIFVGYGGNDTGITSILVHLAEATLPAGVFWVSDTVPGNELGSWLASRNAIWVRHRDFDQLMLFFYGEFGLGHPDKNRFDTIWKTYFETYSKVQAEIQKAPAGADRQVLVRAAEKAATDFGDWWSVELEAQPLKTTDPDRADAIYRSGLEQFPNSPELLGNYALFLDDVRKEADHAEEYYRRAVKAAPSDAPNLGNYAVFLENVRKDPDRAEEYYKRAVEADPTHALNLGNYAVFLENLRKDPDRAEEYYRRAVEADPTNALNLGNYALFLQNVREDPDRAEEYYRRAVEADPTHALNLGNYAVFLENVRKDPHRAEEYYRRAVDADPNDALYLGNYALFLQNVREDPDRAEEYYKRAVDADPTNALNLGNYALFLQNVREDLDRAEEYYKRAVEADPTNALNLGNYAVFLNDVRDDPDRTEDYYRRAVEAAPNDALHLANLGGFLLSTGRKEGMEYVRKAHSLAEASSPQIIECSFYFYAHVSDPGERTEALAECKRLVTSGVRSPDWNLDRNVERAIADKHPEPELLKVLAKVIADQADAAGLDELEVWRNVKA